MYQGAEAQRIAEEQQRAEEARRIAEEQRREEELRAQAEMDELCARLDMWRYD